MINMSDDFVLLSNIVHFFRISIMQNIIVLYCY